MRFVISGTHYDVQSLDRLTLGEILTIESQTAALGRPMKWSQIRAMALSTEGLSVEEFEEHDDAPWIVALVVWASRQRAGEHLTFGDAIDFPLSDMQFLPDTSDHKKAAGPQSPRPDSGRGAKSPRSAKKAPSKTSATVSSLA